MRTTVDKVQQHISDVITNAKHLPDLPMVESFPSLPEVILIRNIKTNSDDRFNIEFKEIIVDISCASAVLRGAHIFAPGVLAMQTNTKINELVNVFVDIEGKCKKGLNVVYKSNQKQFIGIGLVKMQRFQLFCSNQMHGIAIEMHRTISTVPSIGDSYLIDQFALLQNLPSIVCARVLNPKTNDRILDMCAAPGNKTTHLAQLMNDIGTIIALDRSDRRVTLLKQNIQRFQINCVQCFTFDATKSISKGCNTSANNIEPPFSEESFDKILLDAPCSGFGNRPILSTKMTPKILDSYPKLQKKLLDVAARLLKIDGILVYSTCTVFPAENESNVAWFLSKYTNQFELVDAKPRFGRYGLINAGLNDEQCKKVQNFRPNIHENDESDLLIDTTGFFICKLRKIAQIS